MGRLEKSKSKPEIPTLVDNSLHLLTAELQATREAIKSLKSKEEKLLEELKAKVGDVGDGKVYVASDGEEVMLPTYQVNLVQGSNASIKREKLLERGVSPDVIDYATNRSNYIQVRISERKEERER